MLRVGVGAQGISSIEVSKAIEKLFKYTLFPQMNPMAFAIMVYKLWSGGGAGGQVKLLAPNHV